jgi:hypothetical protein
MGAKIKTIEEITLTMTRRQAEVLAAILGMVGGLPNTARGEADAIYNDLKSIRIVSATDKMEDAYMKYCFC